MPGTLGRNHQHVNVSRRNNRFEVNAESMREAKNFSRMEIGLDQLVIHLSLRLVGGENMNPVGALGSLIWSNDHHAVGLRLLRTLARRIESDNNFVSTIAEILRLRV